MTKSVRSYVVLTAVAVAVIGGLIAIQLRKSMFQPARGRGGVTVIRHPGAATQLGWTGQAMPTTT